MSLLFPLGERRILRCVFSESTSSEKRCKVARAVPVCTVRTSAWWDGALLLVESDIEQQREDDDVFDEDPLRTTKRMTKLQGDVRQSAKAIRLAIAEHDMLCAGFIEPIDCEVST